MDKDKNIYKNNEPGMSGDTDIPVNLDYILAEHQAIKDNEWVKDSFLVGIEDDNEYDEWLKLNRFFSTADLKVSDTHVGNSIAINPHYQFTRYADIRRPGLLKSRDMVNGEKGSMRRNGVPGYTLSTISTQRGIGMGTYYSRAIDDNQQRIFLRFGEPQYVSMLIWMIQSFDVHKAILYRRGEITGALMSAISEAGKFYGIFAFPHLRLGKMVLDLFTGPRKFMSVRDNMYTYWTIVDTILNKMFVRRTGLQHLAGETDKQNVVLSSKAIDGAFVQGMNNLVSDIIDPVTGRISVWGICLSGQAAYNRMLEDKLNDEIDIDDDELGDFRVSTNLENYPLKDKSYSESELFRPMAGADKTSTFSSWFMSFAKGLVAGDKPSGGHDRDVELKAKMQSSSSPGDGPGTSISSIPSEEEIIHKISLNEGITDEYGNPIIEEGDIDTHDAYFEAEGRLRDNLTGKKKTTYSRFKEYLEAMLRNGAAFLIMNVEPTGSVGESFSTTTKSNPIEGVFNSLSGKMRSLFDGLGGMASIPGISDAMSFITDSTISFINSATANLFSAPLGILYGATVSLPKIWDDTTTSMPSASYKVKFYSPYGNAYSQLFSIYLPLSAILAAALPRSTGSDTYVSPFMLQLFDRGRVNIPLGMMESVTILRGASNLPFTRTGQPTSIDVDFSIVDLNPMLSVDIASDSLLTRLYDHFSPKLGETSLDLYVNSVVGLDIHNMYHATSRKKLVMLEKSMNLRSLYTDQSKMAAMTVGAIPRLVPFVGAWASSALTTALGKDRNAGMGGTDPNYTQDRL